MKAKATTRNNRVESITRFLAQNPLTPMPSKDVDELDLDIKPAEPVARKSHRFAMMIPTNAAGRIDVRYGAVEVWVVNWTPTSTLPWAGADMIVAYFEKVSPVIPTEDFYPLATLVSEPWRVPALTQYYAALGANVAVPRKYVAHHVWSTMLKKWFVLPKRGLMGTRTSAGTTPAPGLVSADFLLDNVTQENAFYAASKGLPDQLTPAEIEQAEHDAEAIDLCSDDDEISE
jgi:hypothetical protein